MLLVRQSGQDSADATVIINDLRTMKAAALMFDADNPKKVHRGCRHEPY